jgi:Rha family phage regulatory protein
MEDQLNVFMKGNNLYTDSREVAKMVGKRHDHLVRDIDGYIDALSQSPKLGSDNFFKESSYTAGTGKPYKCYLITKKGCEFIANKLTGQKGILFTATYINAFHLMEDKLKEHNNNLLRNKSQK